MSETETTTVTTQAPESETVVDAPKSTATTQAPDIAKLIQASEDRVRTHYSKELKQQQQLIEELRAKTMSESELRKHKETLLSERETALHRKELELYAVDVLKENSLPQDLRMLLTEETPRDVEGIKQRAAVMKDYIQKAVESALQDRFKSAGRDPAKASELPTGKGRTYTQNEVDAEMAKVTRPDTPQSEREAIMKEIHLAMREGRIKK